MLSPSDTAIVFVLALLLFGPEQLPRIARQLGEAMRHMQSTTHAFMDEMERAARVDETPPSGVPAPPAMPPPAPEEPEADASPPAPQEAAAHAEPHAPQEAAAHTKPHAQETETMEKRDEA